MAKARSRTKNIKQEDKRELVISSQQDTTLSKHQQAFNKLVKKIEDLRTELQEIVAVLDEKLDYHSRNIYPIEQQVLQRRKDILKLLFPYYKSKNAFSQNQKKSLLALIKNLLQNVLAADSTPADDELREIFETVEGVSYDEVLDEQFEDMKERVEHMFRDHGIQADLSDLHKGMTQEEINRRVQEEGRKAQQAREQKKEQKASAKKNKKQEEKLEKERLIQEAKNKNLSTIYKQLVKVLHPDLEQDETQKPIKEELMKQLSIAYKSNDLHGLLKLELQWIAMEGNNIQKLTDEKLSIYNDVLKEQVRELEYELYMADKHPRYESLVPFMGLYMHPRQIDLKIEKREREEILNSLIRAIQNITGPNPLIEIRELINIHRHQSKRSRFNDYNDIDF